MEKINEITFRFSNSPVMEDIIFNCSDKYLKFVFHSETQSWIVRVNYQVAEKLITIIDQYNIEISDEARLALTDIIDRKVKGRIYLKAVDSVTNAFVIDYVAKKKAVKHWFIEKVNATWDGREYSFAATPQNAKTLKSYLKKRIFILTSHAEVEINRLTKGDNHESHV